MHAATDRSSTEHQGWKERTCCPTFFSESNNERDSVGLDTVTGETSFRQPRAGTVVEWHVDEEVPVAANAVHQVIWGHYQGQAHCE